MIFCTLEQVHFSLLREKHENKPENLSEENQSTCTCVFTSESKSGLRKKREVDPL
jgi:hypothetical protein